MSGLYNGCEVSRLGRVLPGGESKRRGSQYRSHQRSSAKFDLREVLVWET